MHVTFREMEAADAERAGSSPIGRPLGDLRVYLLDGSGEPVPVGVAGEIHVGGAGVARGYLNRPGLTSERFVASPFVEGDRLYRSGDLARWRADGSLEFLGRNDFQVKVRGFRIELGEIEARLSGCAGVREAVVVAREDRLVAYYTTAAGAQPGAEALRAHLGSTLPDYMVPAAYVRLDALPLTANGKLDRKALPAPDDDAYGARAHEAPVGPVEEALARIWAEVLGVERIGRHDHFFELGGHSLMAVRVLERMRRAGMHADVRVLFGTPTLSALAAAVRTDHGEVTVPVNPMATGRRTVTPDLLPLVDLTQGDVDAIVATVPGGADNLQDVYPLSPLQDGILFHHLMAREGDPYLLWSLMRFRDRATLDRYVAAVEAVVARHDILRTAVVWEGLPEPVQVVWRKSLPVAEEVVPDPADGDVAGQLRRRFDPRRYRLDLRRAPLTRLFVARDPSDGRWVALRLFHHIIDDNTSLKQFNAEVEAHLAGRAGELPAPLPFRNFVVQARSGVSQEEHEAFFRGMLGDVDEPTAPFGLMDVRGDGVGIGEARRSVEPGLARRLRARAQALGVSAASLFHVAGGQVVARATGRPDVVFGTVLFGRMQGGEGADRVMGPYINTLPMRLRLGPAGAEACVREAHRLLTGLIRHEHASLALAQRCSRVFAPMPLFTALLNYRHAGPSSARNGAASGAWEGIEHLDGEERTNYPLTLAVDDLGTGFELTAQVASAVDADRVCAMMHRALESLVEALETAPERPVGSLDVLAPAERRLVADEWNRIETYPVERCIHELFEAQAKLNPDAPAVTFEGRSLSYGVLNARANRLARHLRTLGVGPDRLVAICTERSPEMVVALLAVLKAGGAYLPLDPAYPAERLAFMLADAAPVAVVTDG
ncbi:AMP-binding protein, partial [Arenibaculum sp.]|uniref:AMP-binding protein n=1 Tax=Arenibaculum sp. TaxID=2865862 RepID=UPI002E147E57|nr:AMP-binding protein [Arenibaculum sp.]